MSRVTGSDPGGGATGAGGSGTAWREELRAALTASRMQTDAPLRKATTLRIGGPADVLLELECEADLDALFAVIGRHGLAWCVLGKGSNVLMPDEGYRGVVLRLGRAFSQVQRLEAGPLVRAGAGINNATFVERCLELGLGGMEYLTAIPGTVGGAVAMNAGAHDGETAAFLERVRYYELGGGAVGSPAPDGPAPDGPGARGVVRESDAAALEFGYRRSPLRANEGRLVLAADLRLQPMEAEEVRRRRSHFQQWRREHQPRDFPNCGSVFKNPPGEYAARLIDEAGLKGTSRGDAQVSEKHANFIVNRGAARASDVLALVDIIRETVYSRSQIRLELEMQVYSNGSSHRPPNS